MSICNNCGQEIPEEEVQQCQVCLCDGLGNCCIGTLDHDCIEENEEEE